MHEDVPHDNENHDRPASAHGHEWLDDAGKLLAAEMSVGTCLTRIGFKNRAGFFSNHSFRTCPF